VQNKGEQNSGYAAVFISRTDGMVKQGSQKRQAVGVLPVNTMSSANGKCMARGAQYVVPRAFGDVQENRAILSAWPLL